MTEPWEYRKEHRMPTPKDCATKTGTMFPKLRAVERERRGGHGEMMNQPAMQALTKTFQEMREEFEVGIKELQDEAKDMIELVSISTVIGTSVP